MQNAEGEVGSPELVYKERVLQKRPESLWDAISAILHPHTSNTQH